MDSELLRQGVIRIGVEPSLLPRH
ncbi:hypothetical protein BOS5A_10269 [Bosea sp. EC-HK365B]|nr:hypothetical protein BOSE7B_150335 [Bosea sp. 7B]VVT43925.1 hypothetical protein BOS5A_10269 [Bosea sp. EC-HK365B]VXC38467.1 hypothetical protein BOSE127_180335 [Bosea sp. 127]